MSCDTGSYYFSGSVLRAGTLAKLIARKIKLIARYQAVAACMTVIGFTHSRIFENGLRIRRA
jgi:hypothetical protein